MSTWRFRSTGLAVWRDASQSAQTVSLHSAMRSFRTVIRSLCHASGTVQAKEAGARAACRTLHKGFSEAVIMVWISTAS